PRRARRRLQARASSAAPDLDQRSCSCAMQIDLRIEPSEPTAASRERADESVAASLERVGSTRVARLVARNDRELVTDARDRCRADRELEVLRLAADARAIQERGRIGEARPATRIAVNIETDRCLEVKGSTPQRRGDLGALRVPPVCPHTR